MTRTRLLASAALAALIGSTATAGTGDPQVRTDHPWYPGELAFSNFDRLFAHQAELFARVDGRRVESDEDRALASWMWRNTHYWHGEEGKSDLWGQGFERRPRPEQSASTGPACSPTGSDSAGRPTPSGPPRWRQLLGHCRGRVTGVQGHNSFEVFLTGGPYGPGRWALLDHDVCTVVFDPEGARLLSIPEVAERPRTADRPGLPPRIARRGWPVSAACIRTTRGLSTSTHTAEYLAGYAAAPPMVHLRRGETLRRYLRTRPGRRPDLRLLGPELRDRRHPRPRAAPDLGQPAGELRRDARGLGLPSRPGPVRQRRLHLPSRLRLRRLPRGGRRRADRPRRFRIRLPLCHRRDPARRLRPGGSTSRRRPQRAGRLGRGRLPGGDLDRRRPDLARGRPAPPGRST